MRPNILVSRDAQRSVWRPSDMYNRVTSAIRCASRLTNHRTVKAFQLGGNDSSCHPLPLIFNHCPTSSRTYFFSVAPLVFRNSLTFPLYTSALIKS